ncbi:MAG: ABC transporter permease [Bdellovibrionales bacterium]
MRSIWIIASNTFREIIRDRILYGICVGAVLLIGLSLALGELSFAEQARITTSFGLTSIQLSAVILSIFLGSSLVTKEIEKKTIMTLLVRPVTRTQFLLGKALGLLFLQVTVMTLLAGVLLLIYVNINLEIQYQVFVALHGILLEAIVLLGLALFFSIFATPMMVVAFTAGLFIIGHWLDSLAFFFSKGEVNMVSKFLSKVLPQIVPNLDRFNWRSAVVYGDAIAFNEVLLTSGYAAAWFALLIGAAGYIFRRRDFA